MQICTKNCFFVENKNINLYKLVTKFEIQRIGFILIKVLNNDINKIYFVC